MRISPTAHIQRRKLLLQAGFMFFFILLFFNQGCDHDPELPGEESGISLIHRLPVVTTSEIREVTAASGIAGGVAEAGKDSPILARGVVWSTEMSPGIHEHLGMTTDGEGEGAFISQVDGLAPETIYYLRAYATSEAGTAYGDLIVFSTVEDPVSLDDWIHAHPRIGGFIKWDGTPYGEWSAGMQQQLQLFYTMRKMGLEDIDAYPPENLYRNFNPWDPVITWYLEKDALALYLMNVANSLYLERNELLGWSLLSDDYSDADIQILLDGDHFMRGYVEGEVVEMQLYVLPSPPQYAISFLNEEAILAEDRRETIYRMVDWTSAFLLHFSGGFTVQNFFVHWGYYGAIPVTEMINGRYRADGPIPGVTNYHWTAGCHGTTTFLQNILRSVNIPVEYIYFAEHGFPRFAGDNLYLCHGDSPYTSVFAEADPPLDPAKLLLDADTWHSWFREDDMEESVNNIGRRPYELGVEHMTHGLLGAYCRSTGTGTPFDATGLYRYMSGFFSHEELSEIEAQILEKINEYGHCGNIPTARIRFY